MGAPITSHTPLGKAARPIRKRLRELQSQVSLNPPEGVKTYGHGGKHHLSVHGWLGRSLYDYACANPQFGIVWSGPDQAVHIVRTVLHGGAGGGFAKLKLIEAWLPTVEVRFQKSAEVIHLPSHDSDPQMEEAGQFDHPVDAKTWRVGEPFTFPSQGTIAERMVEALSPRQIIESEKTIKDIEAETQAMATVAKALTPLAEDARRRVLDWAATRYGIKVLF